MGGVEMPPGHGAAMKAAIIAMLLLLGLGSSASAKGAWVAWVHAVFQSESIDKWEPAGAASSLGECNLTAVTAASNAVRKLRAQNDTGTTFTQTGGVIELTYRSGERASIVFVCLPDTVDPRGPKGKP
jgi:hypothetical protein